jgi:hypothetical protein
VSDFLLGVLFALLIAGAIGVAAYFVLRRVFERMSNRVADHIGDLVGDYAARAARTPAGQHGYSRARAAVGRVTRLNAYAASQGLTEDQARREFAESIERTARLMDAAVKLPVIGGVGLDAVLGLVPVAGDVLSAAISVSLIARSLRYGVPPEIIARMLTNVLLDMMLGAVPVAGDLADMWFRANLRNVNLLRDYLAQEAGDVIDVTVLPSTPRASRD